MRSNKVGICAASVAAIVVGIGNGGNARAQDAALESKPLPAADKYDYYPATFDKAQAKADEPPPWFLRAQLLDPAWKGYGLAKLIDRWQRDVPQMRITELEPAYNKWASTWAAEKKAQTPVILPRGVTAAEFSSDAPPEWATSAADATKTPIDAAKWKGLAPVQRRDLLEDLAASEARTKYAAQHDDEKRKAAAVKLGLPADATPEQIKAAQAKKVAEAREAALKDVSEAKLADVLADPTKFAGKAVRVEAKLMEIVGKLSFADEWGTETSCKLVLAQPLKPKARAGVVITFDEWQANLQKYDGMKKATVEATIYVSKSPASEMTDETRVIGRVLEMKAK